MPVQIRAGLYLSLRFQCHCVLLRLREQKRIHSGGRMDVIIRSIRSSSTEGEGAFVNQEISTVSGGEEQMGLNDDPPLNTLIRCQFELIHHFMFSCPAVLNMATVITPAPAPGHSPNFFLHPNSIHVRNTRKLYYYDKVMHLRLVFI